MPPAFARSPASIPVGSAAAIGLEAGEQVQWELLDRGELHLVREQTPPILATQRAAKPAQAPTVPEKQPAKGHRRRGIAESRSRPKS